MKEFVIYTALRLLLFLASVAVVIGVWVLVAGKAPLLWVIVIAFLVSGVASYFLLNRQRAAFASKVDARARRAQQRYEEIRSREDD